MITTTLITALKGTHPTTSTNDADATPAKYLRSILVGRLSQCFPDLRKLVQNQYEIDLRGAGGPLLTVRLRLAADPRDYFWNNASEAFIQNEIVRAAGVGSTPVLLACLLTRSMNRVLVWQLDFNELLAARQAASVPADVASYIIESLPSGPGWQLRYQGDVVLALDVNTPHCALSLGPEERSRLAGLLQRAPDDSDTSATAALAQSDAPGDGAQDLASSDEDVQVDDVILRRMLDTVSERGQIILQGPPGTGKTHYALQFVDLCCGSRGLSDAQRRASRDQARFTPGAPGVHPKGLQGRETAWALVQFHPSYGYEDFVRGVVAEPGEGGQPVFLARDKLFASMCAWAGEKLATRRAILVIDEINRADVARVFGELVMGIEADKRGEAIATPYAIRRADGAYDATLVIPPNLWIVGTMNAADRSVVRFDMALRRRFSFIDILASPAALESYYAPIREASDPDWPEKPGRLGDAVRLYSAVLRMFTRDDGTWNAHGRDHALGPSFFMVPRPTAPKDFRFRRSLRDRIELEVLPQLQEYSEEGVALEDAGRELFARALRELDVFVPGRVDDADFYAKYGDFLGVPRVTKSTPDASASPAAAAP